LEFWFKPYIMIILVSIFLIFLSLLWNFMTFFTKPHVLIPLKKWDDWRINTLLKLAVLFDDVPQHFWSDSILSACYLINCMSSLVLENTITHFIWFSHEPLHPLPLKVFESTCFVHKFCFGLDKLSSRSQKCVFFKVH